MVVVPITAVLPTFYAKNTKASLAAIGVWLVVTRIFDAVSDQAIGFWSDRTGGRLGPRKPWILAGAVVTMLSVVFLFRPTADTGVTYFGVWALIFYLGYTMMNIPYIAWGAELSNDYRERSRIVTWRTVAGSFGGILFLGAPFLLPFDTTEMNAQVLSAVAWGTLILIPVTVAITCFGVPSAAPVVAPPRTPILVLLRSVLANKPFQRYLYVFILGAIQLGFYATLLLMFLDSYLGIGAKFSHIMAATAVVSWLAIPLWLAGGEPVGQAPAVGVEPDRELGRSHALRVRRAGPRRVLAGADHLVPVRRAGIVRRGGTAVDPGRHRRVRPSGRAARIAPATTSRFT